MSKKELISLAIDYLLKNNIPIVVNSARIVLPGDEIGLDTEGFLLKNNLARISFRSKHYDDPYEEYPCDPGVYIVYVDLNTGEVHMPRHM